MSRWMIVCVGLVALAAYGSGVKAGDQKASALSLLRAPVHAADAGQAPAEPLVMGSLDKELIRQVIKKNVNQIRWCYETELTRSPKLAGKVAVKFVIGPSGAVTSSQVATSTANDAALEKCVADRVLTWKFPAPKGPGSVIVTYPFVFKQSGE